MHEDFNKQTYNRQTTSHQDSLCMSIERSGLGQLSKCTNYSFSLFPLDLRGNPYQLYEETSWMGLRSACDLPAKPSSFSDGAPLASSLSMMKDRYFFESTISVSLLLHSEAEFPSLSSSIIMASSCPCAPMGAIATVIQPFILPCRLFLLQAFRLALALDLLLFSFCGSCWCCLSLASAFMFLRCGTLLDTGLVIPAEVVQNKTKSEGSREAAPFPSVLLRSVCAPLTGTHDNRGVGGLVRENAEGTEKVNFLSLGGLGLLNLGRIVLLSLGGLILINIS